MLTPFPRWSSVKPRAKWNHSERYKGAPKHACNKCARSGSRGQSRCTFKTADAASGSRKDTHSPTAKPRCAHSESARPTAPAAPAAASAALVDNAADPTAPATAAAAFVDNAADAAEARTLKSAWLPFELCCRKSHSLRPPYVSSSQPFALNKPPPLTPLTSPLSAADAAAQPRRRNNCTAGSRRPKKQKPWKPGNQNCSKSKDSTTVTLEAFSARRTTASRHASGTCAGV
mmetsp:Transcript_41212/g.95450  ORF Transcript_41212/g.95450 Transcript_41212/m.95450 type:complete len:231 (+) Transcript_41212:889-1581(+)